MIRQLSAQERFSLLVTDNRVFNGSLVMFILLDDRTAHSAHSLRMRRAVALHLATFTLLVRLLRSRTSYTHGLATHDTESRDFW